MKYAPAPKNKKPDVAVITLLVTSVILFYLAPQSFTKGRALVQGFGVLCLSLASFFIIKRLTSYIYTVYTGAATNGGASAIDPTHLTLMISKKTGKSREVNQAEFSLSSLTDVIALPPPSRDRRRLIKGLGKIPLYYYTVTFRAPDPYLLLFKKEDGASVGVVIEPDPSLLDILHAAAMRNKK